MKLIVQIPCYNEESTLSMTLRELPRSIEEIDAIETLIIDDGSTDGTIRVAREYGVEHILELKAHQGLGVAFAAGLDACLRLGADVIVNTDGDNQYCGEDVRTLVRTLLSQKADLVVGTRDIFRIGHFSFTKKWLQRIGSWVVRKVSSCAIEDTTSGFRAFNREAALRTVVFSRFSYTLETLIQAGNSQLKVATVPIRVNERLRDSRLAGSTWTYLQKSAATILRIYAMYHPLRVFSFIGAFVFLGGFVLGCRYLYYYLTVGASGHVQSLILSAILLIVGFQIIVIGLLADLISAQRRLSEDIFYRVRRMELEAGKSDSPASRSRQAP
jgi:glycosyltransferase involved in cell wall biosynthesis